MTTLRDLIEQFHEAEAARPPGAPIRVHRAAILRTTSWRQDVGFLERQRYHSATSPEVSRCYTMAQTGEHLSLERVGLAVETGTEQWTGTDTGATCGCACHQQRGERQ